MPQFYDTHGALAAAQHCVCQPARFRLPWQELQPRSLGTTSASADTAALGSTAYGVRSSAGGGASMHFEDMPLGIEHASMAPMLCHKVCAHARSLPRTHARAFTGARSHTLSHTHPRGLPLLCTHRD